MQCTRITFIYLLIFVCEAFRVCRLLILTLMMILRLHAQLLFTFTRIECRFEHTNKYRVVSARRQITDRHGNYFVLYSSAIILVHRDSLNFVSFFLSLVLLLLLLFQRNERFVSATNEISDDAFFLFSSNGPSILFMFISPCGFNHFSMFMSQPKI